MTKRTTVFALMAMAPMLVGAVIAQKDGLMKRPNPTEIASDHAREILLVMDTDKQGKITKEAWMTFMAAEFDKLDPDGSRIIDPKKLQLGGRPPRPTRSANLGK